MDDATRKAIEDVLSLWGVRADVASARDPLDMAVLRTAGVLREALAREAEYTTLASPEWLDGAEAKRLKFAKAKYGWWETPCVGGAGDISVRMEPPCLVVRDETGHSACFARVPTIAEVRAAVFLATGRR